MSAPSQTAVNPTLTVLLYSALAAAAAVLGPLPLVGRERAPAAWIGWSNALAAGLMLGAAYALSTAGVAAGPLEMAGGALAGCLFILWTHRASATEELDLNRLGGDPDPVYGYQVLLINFLHSASEGVAIGVAMAVEIRFGIFMALIMAVHNIPEATILCAVLRARGLRLHQAAAMAVAANVAQILLAVATFAIVSAAPGLLSGTLGFAVGALIYLTLVELLPESYRQAGPTTIAVVTSVAFGVLIVVDALLR